MPDFFEVLDWIDPEIKYLSLLQVCGPTSGISEMIDLPENPVISVDAKKELAGFSFPQDLTWKKEFDNEQDKLKYLISKLIELGFDEDLMTEKYEKLIYHKPKAFLYPSPDYQIPF